MSHGVARSLLTYCVAIPLAFVAALLTVLLTPIYRTLVFVFALTLAGFVVLARNASSAFVNVAASVARPRL